jgi:hypothetical protein
LCDAGYQFFAATSRKSSLVASELARDHVYNRAAYCVLWFCAIPAVSVGAVVVRFVRISAQVANIAVKRQITAIKPV